MVKRYESASIKNKKLTCRPAATHAHVGSMWAARWQVEPSKQTVGRAGERLNYTDNSAEIMVEECSDEV